MENNLSQQLAKYGFFYDSLLEIENDFRKKFGIFWKAYLFFRLLFFKEYDLKNKIDILLMKNDINNLFLESIYSKKYNILTEHFIRNKINKQLNLPDKSKESIRLYYSLLREIFYKDYYKVNQVINKNDTIVDAGGNLGFYTLFVKDNYPSSKIYIFEPEKKNFKALKKNLKNFSNINFFNIGLGDKNEKKYLKISNKYTFHTVEDENTDFKLEKNYIKKEEIIIKKLDDIVKDKIDVIKMDIEGYELQALKGAKEIINRDQPLLIIAVEHSKSQKRNITKIVNSINKNYKNFSLNKENQCFYVLKKHKKRVAKLKKS